MTFNPEKQNEVRDAKKTSFIQKAISLLKEKIQRKKRELHQQILNERVLACINIGMKKGYGCTDFLSQLVEEDLQWFKENEKFQSFLRKKIIEGIEKNHNIPNYLYLASEETIRWIKENKKGQELLKQKVIERIKGGQNIENYFPFMKEKSIQKALKEGVLESIKEAKSLKDLEKYLFLMTKETLYSVKEKIIQQFRENT